MAKSAKREKNDSNHPEFTTKKAGQGDGEVKAARSVSSLGTSATKATSNGGSLSVGHVGPDKAPYHDAPRAGGLKKDRKGTYGF